MPDLLRPSVLLLLTFALVSFTGYSHANLSNDQLRNDYRAALDARQQGKQEEYQRLKASLRDYLLHPYLEFMDLQSDPKQINASTLKQFQQHYPDSPLVPILHRSWLTQLAKHKRWAQLIAAYDPAIATVELQCHYRLALLKTGQPGEAFHNLEQLWVVGRSLDDSCDPLFKAWTESSYFSPNFAWQRFWLALNNNQRRLARYLQRFVSDPQRQKVMHQALEYHRSPSKLAKLSPTAINALPQRLRETTLLRLSRSNPVLFLEQYERLNLSTQPEAQALALRAAQRLLRSYDDRAEIWAARIDPDYKSVELLEWRIRDALFREDWSTVSTLLDALPPAARFNDRWRYWQAVNLTRGDAEQQQRAEQIFAELARNRSFYGFLAADRIGSSYNLNNHSEPATAEELSSLSNHIGLRRARELFLLDELIDARREWLHATRNANATEQYHLAQLARNWGWYAQAIRATIEAKRWDDLVLRFPLVYLQTATQAAQNNRIDNTWILAIIRQESAFMDDARSPVGAMGLMQLMPATARQTAKHLQIRYRGDQHLLNAEFNILLGSTYLTEMYRRFDKQRALASAAYNAGPHRVKRWLSERGHLPVDAWIETIPFDETRHYVQNTLSYALIYSDLLGLPKVFMPPHERTPLRP